MVCAVTDLPMNDLSMIDLPMPGAATAPAHYIGITGLHKHFANGPMVLEDINLQLARGDFLAIIGPSGCGKSTLLKLIAGLVKPSAGAISFTGSGMRADAPNALRRAFVFQDANLLPWATITDNVALPLRLQGYSTEQRAAQAQRMLQLVKLEHAAKLYPRELSGGMRMRVSIARALATEPELLLLDEPFGALDEMTRDELNEDLLTLRERQHWTALFVTHSVTEAVFLANKVLVLSANPGRVHELIPIDLPYPRTAETRTTLAFQALVAQVTHSLHSVRRQHQ
jgi:NitT/TauT family transport system ATP-binding protein